MHSSPISLLKGQQFGLFISCPPRSPVYYCLFVCFLFLSAFLLILCPHSSMLLNSVLGLCPWFTTVCYFLSSFQVILAVLMHLRHHIWWLSDSPHSPLTLLWAPHADSPILPISPWDSCRHLRFNMLQPNPLSPLYYIIITHLLSPLPVLSRHPSCLADFT